MIIVKLARDVKVGDEVVIEGNDSTFVVGKITELGYARRLHDTRGIVWREPGPAAEIKIWVDPCGVFTSDGLEGSGTGWTCGRPKGHPHDGPRYNAPTGGNHSPRPQPQDGVLS